MTISWFFLLKKIIPHSNESIYNLIHRKDLSLTFTGKNKELHFMRAKFIPKKGANKMN